MKHRILTILLITFPLNFYGQPDYIDQLLRRIGEDINRRMQDVQDDINLQLFGRRRSLSEEQPVPALRMEIGKGLGQWIWEDGRVHDNPNMTDSSYVSIISRKNADVPQMRIYAILTRQGTAFIQAHLVFRDYTNIVSQGAKLQIVGQFDHMPVFKEILPPVQNGEASVFRLDNSSGYISSHAEKKSFLGMFLQAQALQLWIEGKHSAVFKSAGLEEMLKESLRAMLTAYTLDKRPSAVLEEYILRADKEAESSASAIANS